MSECQHTSPSRRSSTLHDPHRHSPNSPQSVEERVADHESIEEAKGKGGLVPFLRMVEEDVRQAFGDVVIDEFGHGSLLRCMVGSS